MPLKLSILEVGSEADFEPKSLGRSFPLEFQEGRKRGNRRSQMPPPLKSGTSGGGTPTHQYWETRRRGPV